MKHTLRCVLSAAVIAATSGAALASDTIHETEDPFGGWFGLVGFDVFPFQSVATRFTPQGNYTLDRVMPWFMNNSDTMAGEVTMTLRNDLVIDGESFPGDEILESWTFTISTFGWNPVQENLQSTLNPLLEEGRNYWLLAESDAPPLENPVWLWAQPDNGWMSVCNGIPCEWSPAATGAVVAVTVLGTPAEPPCAAPDLNCDGTVGVPDLLILLANWGPCKDSSNCPADLTGDGSVGVPDLLLLLANWG